MKSFFDLEYYNKGNDFIHYDYLKKIINCLKECEVMGVLSDHPDAFHLKFEDMCEKKKKYSINVVKLLRDKIRYEYL